MKTKGKDAAGQKWKRSPKKRRVPILAKVAQDVVESPIGNEVSNIPNEILKMHFVNLSSADDLLSVPKLQSQFQEILEPSKPLWSFDKKLPLVYSHMGKQETLHCRVVCKGWKNSADKFFQAHPGIQALELYQAPPHASSFLPALIQKGFVGHDFGVSFTLEVFLRETESHSWNPFITGYLDMPTCPAPEPYPQLQWDDVNSLLTQFGKHILQVNLGSKLLDHGKYTIFDFYKLLEKTLKLMPNLKRLSISGFKYYDCTGRIVHLDEMVQYIRIYSLPELPQLEILELDFQLRRKTEPVIDELMSRYASRVYSISFSLSALNGDKEQYRNMQNLRELKLTIDDYYLVCVHFFESLHAPKLGKVQLTFQRSDLLIPVLTALHKFSPSLAYLKLKFERKPRDSYDSFYSPVDHQMRGVKTLELVESPNVPYDMLLSYIKNLEYVLILCEPKNEKEESSWELDEDQPESGIRQRILSQDIYNSDIWTKMEALKEFTLASVNNDEEVVGKTIFSRGMYDYLKQK